MKAGKSYGTWFKAWKKSGSPKHPDHLQLKAILWRDATSQRDAPTPPMKGVVVGWLITADHDHINLAMEVFEDQTAREYMSIPAGMISGVFDIAEMPDWKGKGEARW